MATGWDKLRCVLCRGWLGLWLGLSQVRSWQCPAGLWSQFPWYFLEVEAQTGPPGTQGLPSGVRGSRWASELLSLLGLRCRGLSSGCSQEQKEHTQEWLGACKDGPAASPAPEEGSCSAWACGVCTRRGESQVGSLNTSGLQGQQC